MSHDLHKNTKKSLISLFFQSGYSAVLGLIANIIITALEAKEVFGIYAATLATIGIFNYLSDIGLAGALIQKKEVKDVDLRTVFTIQQMLILTLVVIGFIATNFIRNYYHLPNQAIYLYWAVLAGFFISSLKTIPSVLLERSVNFAGIVRIQVIENTLFYLLISIGIILRFGLMSFAVAVIVRALVGTFLMYRSSTWRPQLGINNQSFRELISFGLPFQLNSLLALIKDEFVVIFLGKTLGLATLGEIAWAKKWAEAPIRIVMDNISKVLFPVLSRLQDDQEKLKRTVTMTIWAQTLILGPILLISAFAMPYAVHIIPKYAKWQSAVPIFQLFCISAFLSTLSTPFMNVFNALKKPRVPLAFMAYWTITTWILTPIAVKSFGAIGFAYVQVFLSSSFIAVIAIAQRYLQLDFFKYSPKEIFSVFSKALKSSNVSSIPLREPPITQ